jgi:hypothetical protein
MINWAPWAFGYIRRWELCQSVMDNQPSDFRQFATDLVALTSSFHRVDSVHYVYDAFVPSFVKVVLVEDKSTYLTASAIRGNADGRMVANCLRDDFDPAAIDAVATASSGGWLHAWLTSCLCHLTPLDVCKVLIRLYEVGYVTLSCLYLWRRMVKTRKRRAVSELKRQHVRAHMDHNNTVLGRRPLRRKLCNEYVPQ